MKNQSVLIGTGIFAVAFLVFGLFEMLDNPVIMIIMIAIYLFILAKIIMAIAKSVDSNKKTTPKRGS